MTSVILVPVKDPALAKSRMSPFLNAQERSLVARAMLEDLVGALLPLAYPVAVVTNSQPTAARVKKLGWKIIWEEQQISESASIDSASRRLEEKGAEAVLRLPADLPLIQSQDITELFSFAETAPCAVLAPSHDHTGTNALLRMPPTLFASYFGANSLALHVAAAEKAGAHIVIVRNPRLALDLDNPADIARFLSVEANCETYRTLMSLKAKEKLTHYAIQNDPHARTGRDS